MALLTPAFAFAQNEAQASVSAGYDFRRVAGHGGASLPAGWFGEFALNMTPFLATVGQVTAHYKNVGAGNGVSLYTFGAGLRLSSRNQKAAPFAQLLVGTALLRSNSIAQLPPNHIGPTPFGLSGPGGSALLQVGIGVELLRDAPIGLRVGSDYVVAGDEIGNMTRFAIAVVVPLSRDRGAASEPAAWRKFLNRRIGG